MIQELSIVLLVSLLFLGLGAFVFEYNHTLPLNPTVKFCQDQGHDALAYEIDNWVVCKNFVESCIGNYCKTTEEFFEYVF